MLSSIVKDIMIPVKGHPAVSADATLAEAQTTITSVKNCHTQQKSECLTVLVKDKSDAIVGKIDYFDILQSLDLRYNMFGDLKTMSRFGMSPEFFKHMAKDMELLTKPLDDLCRKAGKLVVRDIMEIIQLRSCIKEDATINDAIHYFITSRKDTLHVTDGKTITGIVYLGRIADEVGDRICRCQ